MERDTYESKFERDIQSDKFDITYNYHSIKGILLATFLSTIFFIILFSIGLSLMIPMQNMLSQWLNYPMSSYIPMAVFILIIGFGEVVTGAITIPQVPYPIRAFRDIFLGCFLGTFVAFIIQLILMGTAFSGAGLIVTLLWGIPGGLAGGSGALLAFRYRGIRNAEWFVNKVEMEGEYLRFMGEYERMVALYEKALDQLNEALSVFENSPSEDATELVIQMKTQLNVAKDLTESMGYTVVSPRSIKDDVHVLRGCEVIGGRFEYKVKVSNESKQVITDVHIRIVGYPDDSLKLVGEAAKTISRIEVGGFRSPQFVFQPTRDCVEGKVLATVSFMDPEENAHTIEVKPYVIKSVCDLLKPFETTTTQFNLLLENMKSNHQEHLLPINPVELYSRIEALLKSHNFYIIDKDETSVGSQYFGTMKGLAVGKYSEKKVAIAVSVVGNEEGRESSVSIDILGEDLAMIPITMEEISKGIESWTCPRCGGPISPEQLILLRSGNEIECPYCHKLFKISDYSKGET